MSSRVRPLNVAGLSAISSTWCLGVVHGVELAAVEVAVGAFFR